MESSLKQLARAAGSKNAALAAPAVAERTTGFVLGGIGPFGTRRRFDVWVQDGLQDLHRIAINGGRRGVLLVVDPKAAFALVEAQIAAIDASVSGC